MTRLHASSLQSIMIIYQYFVCIFCHTVVLDISPLVDITIAEIPDLGVNDPSALLQPELPIQQMGL